MTTTAIFVAQGANQDITVAEAPLEPLAYEGIAAPIADIQPRLSFWLVTFLCGEQDRLFWGYIDWA